MQLDQITTCKLKTKPGSKERQVSQSIEVSQPDQCSSPIPCILDSDMYRTGKSSPILLSAYLNSSLLVPALASVVTPDSRVTPGSGSENNNSDLASDLASDLSSDLANLPMVTPLLLRLQIISPSCWQPLLTLFLPFYFLFAQQLVGSVPLQLLPLQTSTLSTK